MAIHVLCNLEPTLVDWNHRVVIQQRGIKKKARKKQKHLVTASTEDKTKKIHIIECNKKLDKQ